jgi:hypothetical protein
MRRRHSYRIRILLAAIGLSAAAACLAQVPEGELKAAYIYNFALFTTWPEPGAPRSPFYVCANADGALWSGLSTLSGKPVDGHPWTVVDLPHAKGQRCHIAVLARNAERPAFLGNGVLVVRDGGHGAASIVLVDDDEHIRFDVDTQDAARNGLRFSSRLLRLARNVL